MTIILVVSELISELMNPTVSPKLTQRHSLKRSIRLIVPDVPKLTIKPERLSNYLYGRGSDYDDELILRGQYSEINSKINSVKSWLYQDLRSFKSR